MKQYINQALYQLKDKNRIPFHMPGHKRHSLGEGMESQYTKVYELDITEISDYDNLHHPEGIIRESMDELKKIYGTRESWYVINGSTAGILSSISAVCDVGDKIIIGRNCHKAVYNIIKLLHLKPIYIYPQYEEDYDMLSDYKDRERDRLSVILEKEKDVKAVFITSPTYEGVVSDIRAMKDLLEPYGIPLIVDEAHGAHMIFHKAFPKSAVECGADIVIQSAHKTLPAATQTALLHLCSDLIPAERIFDTLSTFETSSPSYLMMASIEKAVAYMQEHVDRSEEYVSYIHNFRSKCGQLSKIHLISREDVDSYDYDQGKLVFSLKNTTINGRMFFDTLLQEYGIELEMANDSYGIAMTSICDQKEDFDRLYKAVKEIDEQLVKMDDSYQKVDLLSDLDFNNEIHKDYDGECIEDGKALLTIKPEKVYEMWECRGLHTELVPLEESIGRIAGEFVQLYPPDIPLLVPGEKIQKEMVENIARYLYNGYNVLGICSDKMIVLEDTL